MSFETRRMICLITTVCLVAAVQLTHAASCPKPSAVEIIDIGHDYVTFGWNATEHLPSPLHCACGFPGVYANVCSADTNSSDCSQGVTGHTTTQRNLRPAYTHTLCVQTQCSATNFSLPFCVKFRTLPSESSFVKLAVSVGSPTQLQLSWTTLHEAAGCDVVKHYEVSWWKHGPRQNSAPATGKSTILTNETSMNVDKLEPHTAYAVQAVAVCQSGNVTTRRPSTIASATTYPEGLVRISDVIISTTNRRSSVSDVSVKWTAKSSNPEAIEQHEYRVTLCVGSEDVTENCRNTTVQGGRSRVTFAGVPNFATLLATVRPVFKIPGNVFEGEESRALGTSWMPEVPKVEDLALSDVTGRSARVSWSKLKELDGVVGAYYRVVLRTNKFRNNAEEADGGNEEQVSDASEGAVEQVDTFVRDVPASEASLELLDLKPWTSYVITVTPGATATGVAVVGESSGEAFETPAEPPTEPRSVSFVERGGDRYLTWLPPESWNGPRGGYEVSIACVQDIVRSSKPSVVLGPHTTEYVAPSLTPATSCTLGVHAFNVYRGESLDGGVVWVRLPLPGSEDAAAAEQSSN